MRMDNEAKFRRIVKFLVFTNLDISRRVFRFVFLLTSLVSLAVFLLFWILSIVGPIELLFFVF